MGPTNYWLTFLADPVTILFLIGWEIFIRRSNPLITTLAFAGGLAAWTLL